MSAIFGKRIAIRAILNSPVAFDLFQTLVGASRVHQYFLDNFVRPFAGCAVLDIGCGTGALRPFLGECKYVGMDVEGKYIQRAIRKCHHSAEFVVGDVADFEVVPDSYDIIISAGVIHHLDDARASDLVRLGCRALKEGGRLCSLDMCDRGAGFAGFLNKMDRGRFVRTEDEYKRLALSVFRHVTVYDYCGKLRIPVSHCVMVCTKKSEPSLPK